MSLFPYVAGEGTRTAGTANGSSTTIDSCVLVTSCGIP